MTSKLVGISSYKSYYFFHVEEDGNAGSPRISRIVSLVATNPNDPIVNTRTAIADLNLFCSMEVRILLVIDGV